MKEVLGSNPIASRKKKFSSKEMKGKDSQQKIMGLVGILKSPMVHSMIHKFLSHSENFQYVFSITKKEKK